MKKPNIELQVTADKELILEQTELGSVFMVTMKENGEGNAFTLGAESDIVHNVLAAIDGDDNVMKLLSVVFGYVMIEDDEKLSPNLRKMKRNVMVAVIHEARENGTLEKVMKHAEKKAKGSN